MSSVEKNILISLWLESDANRRFLHGISLFARQWANWNVRFVDTRDLSDETLEAFSLSKFDAFFVKEDALPTFRAHFGDDLPPTAVFGTPNNDLPIKDAMYFSVDGNAIGTKAAEYFLSLGNFASYGFYTEDLDQSFVHDRLHGYIKRLSADNITASVCTSYGNLDDTVRWLSTLQKPVAIFCANINYAVKLIAACKTCGLKIQKQVAVLGVDDDELLGGFIKPRPSTIALPYEKLGMEAAKAIAKRLRRPSANTSSCLRCSLTDMQIVEHDSSAALSPATHLISRALDFIKHNAAHRMTVDDVANHVGTSRKLLELRFREICNDTILAHIHRARLDKVCADLTYTAKSIQDVSRDCGFTNLTYLKTFFRRQTGMTMTEYRLRSVRSSACTGSPCQMTSSRR